MPAEGHPLGPDVVSQRETYVPALRFRFLTNLYDPVVALTTRERTFKRKLLEQVSPTAGSEVLDLGCGTGTLTTMISASRPGARVTGVDGDPGILAIARAKARRQASSVRFEQGLAESLPFPDGSFDRVVSSLFFHHLSPEMKARAAVEVHRVLKPGGTLHVADWGRPSGPVMRILFLPVQLLDGFENTQGHVAGQLPQVFRDAGLRKVSELGRLRTMFGSLSFYRGTKPEE